MTPSKLEILNDHYKDTFSYQRDYLKRRDRLSLYLLITLMFMFIELLSTSETETIILKLISKYLGNDLSLETSLVRCLIWFFLFGLVVRYCQSVVLIERQYAYLHKLEKELRSFFSTEIPFTREGKSYLRNYPIVSQWSHILYTWVFPIVLLLFTGIKIIIEFPNKFSAWIVSAVFCSMIWITIGLYIWFMVREKDETDHQNGDSKSNEKRT